MILLIVLTIVNGTASKTVVAEYPTKELCLKAKTQIDPTDYPGHYLTACLPKLN